jgi:subtilisin family serine protease
MKNSTASTLTAVAVAAAISACTDNPTQPQRFGAPDSPLLAAAPAAGRVAGQYIVVFDKAVSDVPGLARRLAMEEGAEVRHTYERALKGFSARMSAHAAERLARNPHVTLVEEDQVMRATTVQANATWGLDRVDQRTLPLSGSYTSVPTGAGVTVYIIDTGIRFDHAEFGGRAASGYDAIDGGSADDCNGHGTHVAGTVGGTAYGVAKNVKLVGVRVLDCGGSGTTSGVIAGIDWVTANAAKPEIGRAHV